MTPYKALYRTVWRVLFHIHAPSIQREQQECCRGIARWIHGRRSRTEQSGNTWNVCCHGDDNGLCKPKAARKVEPVFVPRDRSGLRTGLHSRCSAYYCCCCCYYYYYYYLYETPSTSGLPCYELLATRATNISLVQYFTRTIL